MRVEKLELHGFKSFGEKTVFNLHPGITCIVGPNGCGKSNVVDAFKWVLGEQSAKSLRGDKMEQVIFNGSQSRKPRGMAEVRLVVRGLGAPENGEGEPLVVGRRLYRSGDSDYMLNRQTCRLRDVRDVFLDTGLEVKSYSILEQDRISAVLSAKPEERRFLLEEVAGVVKYKVRRNEAQSKLESSRQNLQRITDIVAEIRRQINSLDRQVKKAERFKKLTEELRAVELKIARHDYAELDGALGEILSEQEALREEEAAKKAGLSRAEAAMETGRIALAERARVLNGLLEELQGRQKGIAEKERAIAVLRAECDNMRENLGRLKQEEEETHNKDAAAKEREAEIGSLLAALESEVAALSGRMKEKETSLSESEGEISRIESLLEERRREVFRISDELGALRNAHGRHAEAREAVGRRVEGLDREAAELDTGIEEARSALGGIEAGIRENEDRASRLHEERENIEGELKALRERREAMRLDAMRAREELASASSRLESLREIVLSGSAASELSGEVDVAASVADIVEAPEEYEQAVESALGEAASGLLLRGRDDLIKAVSAIRTKDVGRTAFISLVDGADMEEAALPEGAIAMAADLVKAHEGYAEVVRRLLAGVVVARDIESALEISGRGRTVVTLGGECVAPSGAVIAGRSRGILALKRQTRELEEDIEKRRASIAALEGGVAEAESNIGQKETALAEAASRAVEAEKEKSLLKLKAEKQAEEMERAERKRGVVGMEREQGARERSELDALIEEKARAITKFEEDKSLAEKAVADMQEAMSARRSGHEQERAESVDLRLELSSIAEKMNSLRRESESVRGLMEELKRKAESIRAGAAQTHGRIAEREEEAKQRDAELREAVVKARDIEGRISSERDGIASGAEAARSEEQGIRALRAEIEALARKLSELEVQRAEHKLRMENLVENVRNAYAVEVPEVEAEPLAGDEHGLRDEIKAKIENLGPVSLGSIEEYEELKGRYDFLHNQQEDLDRSIAELEEAISRINATTRKNLREAYEALKVKFSEVFVSLFGGGRAELVLTDEKNILETGIDVVAQPPGKRQQNITLLSGGEKTLTALALLFASFLIKPTPLCILDEADAALDDSNTLKFAEMIKELAKDIQFIVVTHNRVTMEAAHYIYGITMEEPGVSKVLSMQLAEA